MFTVFVVERANAVIYNMTLTSLLLLFSGEIWVFSFVIKFYPPDPFSLQDEATR